MPNLPARRVAQADSLHEIDKAASMQTRTTQPNRPHPMNASAHFRSQNPTCYPEDTVAQIYRFILLLACSWSALAQSSGVLAVLSEELDRNFTALKQKADPAPYFMSYAVTDEDYSVVSASFGAITSRNQSRNASLDVCVRVGSPKLDNYHRVRGERGQFTSGSAVVIEDTPLALKRRLWLDTDRTYRIAAERLIKIRTNSEVKVKEEDQSDDFSVVALSVL